ncbi:hypothetical protein XENTR_v10017296 [Xenopus tropicalis]|nr:hypothetical protein XENTR_v10017296 [Xenopus tropicalis]
MCMADNPWYIKISVVPFWHYPIPGGGCHLGSYPTPICKWPNGAKIHLFCIINKQADLDVYGRQSLAYEDLNGPFVALPNT